MPNPILQKLLPQNQNNIINTLMAIKDPNAAFGMLMNSNPQFRQFYNDNKDKSPEQIMRENNIDPEQVRKLMR